MNGDDEQEPLHDHEANPGPDGRVPSSTGRPSITIKTPGPEGYDPRAAEIESPPQQVGTRRDEDIFPVIDRGEE